MKQWDSTKRKKILVINGSHKGHRSATLSLTNAFLEGIREEVECDIELINIADINIKPCMGCLSCWGRTPGECVIKNDDIIEIKNKINDSDIFIESFPLYFFGMPGTMKMLTDRLMGMMNTYSGQLPPSNGESFHGVRQPHPKRRFVIISSCAYTASDSVYEPLLKQYDCICGKDNYTALYTSQVKTLLDLKQETRINNLLNRYKLAGKEFARNGFLSDETKEQIKKPPFSDGAYKVLLEKFWEQEGQK